MYRSTDTSTSIQLHLGIMLPRYFVDPVALPVFMLHDFVSSPASLSATPPPFISDPITL